MDRHYHVTVSGQNVTVFRIADNGDYLPDTVDAIAKDICPGNRDTVPLAKVPPSSQRGHLTGGGGTIVVAVVFILVLAAALWWGPDIYGSKLSSWEQLPFLPPDYPG